MTKIISTPFGDYAEVPGTTLVKVDYSDPDNPTGMQLLKHEGVVYNPPRVRSLYPDEFIAEIAMSTPGLSPLVQSRHKLASVEIVETNRNCYDDVSSYYHWKGARLVFEPANENGSKFAMEIYRVYAKTKPNYYKSHGEIRYFHRVHGGRMNLTFERAPLKVFLNMCATSSVRNKLLDAARKTDAFSLFDTPLEPQEVREARFAAKQRAEELQRMRERKKAEIERIKRIYGIK